MERRELGAVHTRTWYMKQLHRRPVIWLAWIAAILYSSWPLGYVLDPVVGHHELASQLEALHQPYAWLFVTTDVLTCLTLIIAGLQQISTRDNAWFKWCTLSYLAFALLVAAAALSPLNCNPE